VSGASAPAAPQATEGGTPGDRLVDGNLRGVVTGLSRQNSVYRHMIEVCDQIADATLTGADARELSRMLARLIRKTVVLLDSRFGLRACAGEDRGLALSPHWQPDDPGLGRLLRALAAERRPLRVPAVPDSVLTHGCLAIPIGIGATNLGYLLILDSASAAGDIDRPDGSDCTPDTTDDVDLLTASYVATLFALTLANERTNTDLGLRYEGAIVDALVSGHFTDPEDAQRKSKALGIAEGQHYRVAVVRSPLDQDGLAEQAEELRSRILAAVPGTALAVRQGELVMILPSHVAPAEDQLTRDRLRDALEPILTPQGRGAALTCGLSDHAARPDRTPQLFREAAHAIEIGTRIGLAGQIIFYGDLGIYRLLLQIGDMDQLRRYADEVLGPLIRYDATHKLGLVRTLSVFLDQRESLKQAARRLHVHANTVAYRLQRIEQLTPLNLANPNDRLVAHVAVKILDAQKAN
jgi:PucR C-terminal helix-turn-helix domain/GGDEF-like domain